MTPAIRKALEKLGLKRDIDFALHLPLRYEDETKVVPIAEARDGRTVLIEATVVRSEVQPHPRRQLRVEVEDASGSCQLRFLHFYPSQQKTLAPGKRLRLHGEVRSGFWGKQMVHPQLRKADAPLPTALTPIYPTSQGLPQAYLRRLVATALGRIELGETLTTAVIEAAGPAPVASYQGKAQWWGLREALTLLHHPPPDLDLAALQDHNHPAWQRLKAEELLAQQLSKWRIRQMRHARAAPRFEALCTARTASTLPAELLRRIPFALTGAQQRVFGEIAADMSESVPMHRLLQGDVGSGKTIVAALAACVCMDAGWQCTLMAPTELLAQQHFKKMQDWLSELLAARGLRVVWLAGAQKKKERALALAQMASGEAALVVGTHAVIQEQVTFKRLGLVLIDEQHRFGVAQRLSLRKQQGEQSQQLEPHMLMMSATPIPRTLAMTYYADLSVSTIDELPPGRSPIVTRLIAENRRDELIQRLAQQLRQGRQAYWVCPLIEESETLDLSNASATHEELQSALPGQRVGLLHSRMPAAEKHAVMAAFSCGELSVMVSTTVIEVGVDVPNASLMVVEHAERFGLAQLHQLRGRVGRGSTQSACILLYPSGESGALSETAKQRLRAMAGTQDGFEIARRDLDIRGPGEFMGDRQSGAALLRFADLGTDQALLEWTSRLAPLMLQHHPALADAHLQRWLGGKWDYLKA